MAGVERLVSLELLEMGSICLLAFFDSDLVPFSPPLPPRSSAKVTIYKENLKKVEIK